MVKNTTDSSFFFFMEMIKISTRL